LTTGSTVTFSGPNIPSILTFFIDPLTLGLTLKVPIDPDFAAYLVLVGAAIATLFELAGSGVGPDPVPAIPPFTGALPVNSPAHYYSFVPSCDQDGCDGYWVATNLEILHV